MIQTNSLSPAEQLPHYEELHVSLNRAITEYTEKTGWKVTRLSFTATPGVSELRAESSPLIDGK
jgi:hypothetical protein